MPRNGSGTYSLPAGNPVVTGTTISSTVQNNTTSDIASALTQSIAADGQTPVTANIPFGGNKLTGLGAGTAATDAAQLQQAQGSAIQFGTVTGTDTILLTLVPAITAYAPGQTFRFVAAGANTTIAPTVNANSVGAKNLMKRTAAGPVALAVGDIQFAQEYSITYDGTQFLLNEQRTYSQGTTVASATTTILNSATGDYVHISGVTTITAITLAQGEQKTLIFDGILTFTNGASLILPSGANIITAAGDMAVVRGEASAVVRCINYVRATGIPFTPTESANTVFAGPSSGGAALPTFRALIPADLGFSPITNSLSGDISLSNIANYFDGPSIAQGTSGTWFVSGTVTLTDTASANFFVKLWDGTTVIASAACSVNTNFLFACTLSGYLASPAANLRISVRDSTNTSGTMKFNSTGNSKDSTISAIRIA